MEPAKTKPNRNSKVSKGPLGALDWRTNTRAAIEVYWSEIPMEQIRLVIDAVSRGGGAVMFGKTSDGGALSVCVLQDDTKLKRYPHNLAEWDQLAEQLVDAYTGR